MYYITKNNIIHAECESIVDVLKTLKDFTAGYRVKDKNRNIIAIDNKDEFINIAKHIMLLEKIDSSHPRYAVDTAWVSDRITWAYKFRKISKSQMEELCDAFINYMEGNY